ncbi:hypothetical protein [Ekhidna sp. To15]|uniref:hypothetical protein n=1 Tax=Ekhidna sp. To15 TaxID=3395267 RepID=UPI003F51C034
MKKLLTIFSIALLVFSCEEFSDGIYSGPDQVAFARTTATGLYLEEAATGDNDLDSLEVQLIGPQRSTATDVNFELDATANQAIEGVHIDFVTTGGTLTIPANASSGYIYFNVLSDNFSISDNINLVVNLTSTDIKVAGNFAQTTKSLAITCESNLAGDYSAVSSGSSTDGCVAGNGNTVITNLAYSTVTITEGSGVGVYTISNSFAGLYDAWYVPCYGYSAGESNPLTDVCGDLSGSWLDIYAPNNPFAMTGSVDGSGVITLSWTNAFGDQGTTVLTPIP